jgi:hypothetical protein
MSVIPIALIVAGASINYWTQDLTVQGTFPGRYNMMIYGTVCVTTVLIAMICRWRAHRRLSL